MKLFHSDEISAVLLEARNTLQQAQIAIASIQELTANAEQTREKLDAMLSHVNGILESLRGKK